MQVEKSNLWREKERRRERKKEEVKKYECGHYKFMKKKKK